MSRLRPLAVLAVLAVSCTTERPLAPPPTRPSLQADLSALNSVPQVGISQVYGGGGNSGATLKNDFIEVFNRSGASVNVTGWSVQYGAAAGTTWQVTNLTGSIPAGGHYLVQEAQGAGGTVDLPAPDATGTIAMAAGAGK